MVEVPQVGELVAERIHEARVLERSARSDVAQPDLDRAVGVADPIAAAHSGALGGDRAVPETEAAREALGIEIQTLDQLSRGVPIQARSSFLPRADAVKSIGCTAGSGNVTA